MDNRGNVCRLCLTTCDTNVPITEGVARQMQEELLLHLALDLTLSPIMCIDCETSLQKSYNFKQSCLGTEKKILPFSDKQDTKLDLKEMCLGIDNELSNILDNLKVCRFCFKLTNVGCLTDLRETKENMFIVNVILKHIPEMNLNITEELVACETCLQSLHDLLKFVTNCLNVEEQISGSKETEETCGVQNITLKREAYATENNMSFGSELEVKTEDDAACYADVKLRSEVAIKLEKFETVSVPVKAFTPAPAVERKPRRKISGYKPFRCEECGFRSKFRSVLTTHKLTHRSPSEVTMYKCNTCSYETKLKGNLKKHLVSHKSLSEVPVYKCNVCSYEAKHKGTLKLHALTHKSPSELTMHRCDVCLYETKLKGNLKKHVLSHMNNSDTRTYKCDSCGYETKHKGSLKIHMLSHRSPTQLDMFKCDVCEFRSKHKGNLKKHILNVHRPELKVNLYKCGECPYECNHKGNMQKHQLTHRRLSEVVLYKCEACTYATQHKESLRVHARKHSSEQDAGMFNCEFCTYKSRRSQTVKSHVRRHHALIKQERST